ncbi:hypothetical protein PM082_013166 [Marasmius tenuissimus]|nr:hypothetical protein PM082_013166 [Marasmius tenuissimus]
MRSILNQRSTGFHSSARLREIDSKGKPYSSLTVGVPRETYPDERRVSLTPQNTALLLKKGYGKVLVEENAGAEAKFLDEQYASAGATMVSKGDLYKASDIVLKVRPPSLPQEVDALKEGSSLISFLYPAQNKELVERLAARNVDALAMDMIPRISRAQVFDALRPVGWVQKLEDSILAQPLENRFNPSAHSSSKYLCKRMVAEEEVTQKSWQVSKEFIEAEMALFMEQCKEVDIVITTALIPGKPAPKLITSAMVAAMKQGSVIVDLASEAGGNCEATVPGQLVVKNGVSVIGYTDLPSRLPTQSSTLYSNNVTKFLLSLGEDSKYLLNLEDEVVRGSLVTHQGKVLPPVPRAMPPAPATPPSPEKVKEETTKAITPFQKTSREVAAITTAMGGIVALGKTTGTAFMDNFFTFGLAGLVGYRVVWNVAPALHSPLMSVTNAISGMVGIGGLFVMGGGYFPGTIPQTLGALSVLLASVNVAGGFIITKRMVRVLWV